MRGEAGVCKYEAVPAGGTNSRYLLPALAVLSESVMCCCNLPPIGQTPYRKPSRFLSTPVAVFVGVFGRRKSIQKTLVFGIDLCMMPPTQEANHETCRHLYSRLD
jgi:hypothetical protein